MQPQLLRVLEAGQIKRLGEARYRPIDVRVIAATNRDLQRAVNTNAFRADLFYRLAVVRLRVPPLAQRPEDIDLLVPHLLQQIAPRGGGPKALPQLTAETLRQLANHPWPGNVRELRNFLERLVALSGSRRVDLSTELELTSPIGRPSIDHLEELPFKEAKAQWTAHFDVEYLTRLLQRCDNNVAEAARRSGVDRVHLFRLIKKYGLRR
jgi:DNA-binding NtrC family response regulator